MIDSSLLASVVNLNGPGRYLHWSIFVVSEANLVLIVVMVVIFGAALMIRFPSHQSDAHDDPDNISDGLGTAPAHKPAPLASDFGEEADAAMWTSRLRRQALRLLPPGSCYPTASRLTWRRGSTCSAWQPWRRSESP